MKRTIKRSDIAKLVMESVNDVIRICENEDLYNHEIGSHTIERAYEIIDGYMEKIHNGDPLSREQIETLKYQAELVAQYDGNIGMDTYNEVMCTLGLGDE